MKDRSRTLSQVCWSMFLYGVLAVSQATAQNSETSTGVRGTIVDQSGAVVPAAAVTIVNGPAQGRTTSTDNEGVYRILGLPAGTYTLSVSASGFKELQPTVAVRAGEITTVDTVLSPADATGSSVEVVGGRAAQVETDTAAMSGTVTEREVLKYGLNGRNFTQLIALTPGVSNQTGQDEAKVGVVGSVKYSVNGGRVEYNTFDVDGADLSNTGINGSDSTLIVYPSLDAIQEIKVLTSNYGAMYGRTASGTVLVATKSGTEQFHGNGYYFGRNEFFNARNFFDQTKGAPLYRRHDFGGTIGGPVYIPGHYNTAKDKTFFFFSEEYRLEKSPFQFNQAVPSEAERQGDFSDVCPNISPNQFFSRLEYPDCPGILPDNNGVPGVPIGSRILYRRPYPGNKLPAIDRNAAAILASGIIPAPNSSAGCNSTIQSCYVQTVSPATHWREELFRLDHNFTPNTRAFFRFIHDAWDTVVATPQWSLINNSFPTVQNDFVGPGISLVGRVTQILSPSIVNEAVFTYGNSTITLNNLSGPGADVRRPAALDEPCTTTSNPNYTQCPVGYLFGNGFGGKMPGIIIEGTNAAYGGNGFAVDSSYMPWRHSNPVFTIADNLSMVVGKHNLQLGAEWQGYFRDQTNGPIGSATGDLQGTLRFGTVASSNTTGNAFADFLYKANAGSSAGAIKSYTQDSAQSRYFQRYQILEPYFQDDWRVTSRLTVNLGLRVSLFGTYREKNRNAYNWVESAYDPALASTVYVNPFLGNLNYNNQNSDGSSIFDPIPLDLDNLDPRITNGLVRCGTNGVPAGCMTGHLFNPAPRVGFAWDPTGSGKMAIRGGYGIFFEHGTGNEANTGSLEASSPVVVNMTQYRPQGWGCIGGANPEICNNPSSAFPLNVASIPTKAIWPYVQQWSINFQRELPGRTVGTIAYVGSKGTHLTNQRQLNQLAPVPDSKNPFGEHEPLLPYTPTYDFNNPSVSGDCASLITNGYFQLQNGAVINPGDSAFVNMQAACFGYLDFLPNGLGILPDINTLRQFAPSIGRIIALENSANSSYNSLQATLRRVEGPLTLGVSYTYSHSMDNSSDRSDNTFVNSYNLRANRANSNFDQRHLLNVSYIYELPFLRFLHAPSSRQQKIFGGWELSGITIYQSGTPFSVINGASASPSVSVVDNAGVANGIGLGSYPDLVGDPYGTEPAGGNNGLSFGPLLLNPGAFAAPRGLTFGNAGRNALNNPSRWNFDMSLLKQIPFSENRNVELRFEVFNLFNNTQFRIFDPNLGNRANNTITCYAGAGAGYSAAGGDGVDCLTGRGFLHPVNAHRPRTIQFGLKFAF